MPRKRGPPHCIMKKMFIVKLKYRKGTVCSEVVSFRREWRAFIRYGTIWDVWPYRGDWSCQYDPEIIEQAVRHYINAPAGYAMDFGVTESGKTLLVEVIILIELLSSFFWFASKIHGISEKR